MTRKEAQQKNFAKMRLASVPSALRNALPYVTKSEQLTLNIILKATNKILNRWG